MSDNNLFTEINTTEEATLSGGHCHGYYPRRRYLPSRATASASANAFASANNAFASSFSDARVDRYGNAFAISSSFSFSLVVNYSFTA